MYNFQCIEIIINLYYFTVRNPFSSSRLFIFYIKYSFMRPSGISSNISPINTLVAFGLDIQPFNKVYSS